jgi:predicted transcriptional regulator
MAKTLKTLTADIVAAYVGANRVSSDALPSLISETYAALSNVDGAAPAIDVQTVKATPAQIRKSVQESVLISFEDGRPYRTLKRHLTMRGLTPESYREKWGLPFDYPMVSPGYAKRRSEVAKATGLGKTIRRSGEGAK